MYQQPDPILVAVSILAQVVAPLAVFMVFVWLAAKAVAALAALMSPDQGLRRTAQRHRHRLENLTALVAVASYATGLALLVSAPAEGGFKLHLPGGLMIENAGIPVLLLTLAESVLWVLLNARRPEGGTPAETGRAATPVRPATAAPAAQGGALAAVTGR